MSSPGERVSSSQLCLKTEALREHHRSSRGLAYESQRWIPSSETKKKPAARGALGNSNHGVEN
jgi:hypothetical protein